MNVGSSYLYVKGTANSSRQPLPVQMNAHDSLLPKDDDSRSPDYEQATHSAKQSQRHTGRQIGAARDHESDSDQSKNTLDD